MKRIAYVVCALAFAIIPAMRVTAQTSTPGTMAVGNDTPSVVSEGLAATRAPFSLGTLLHINVGMQVRNSAQLDQIIARARTPGSRQYGHYLTRSQYMAGYAPTVAQVQAVKSWLAGQGLTVTGVSSNNLLVHVQATAAQAERAFGVGINDYRYQGRSFFSNDRNPTVPANLSVHWISGLSNFDVFKPNDTCNPGPGGACAYDGVDLRAAYDAVGDGTGQTIGFTLWGGELPSSDYTGYANATKTTAITVNDSASTGDDILNFIQVGGAGTNSTATDSEIALDTQNAHAVAPGIHETYWLGADNQNSTLENVLSQAPDPSISIISNSWGAQANPCVVDSTMEEELQEGAAIGKTFFFSTGDAAASSGCEYPAVSQYVVAVGGTNLQLDNSDNRTSETAVNDGGGCLGSETRPSWQTGIGTPQTWGSPPTNCSGRAEPDVSALSGFCTDKSNCGPGTYVYFDGADNCCYGGTSLATPVWAAGAVLWNKNNAGSGRPGIGFAGPLIYALANDPTTYPLDFHDITSGTNGFAAGTGWDEATGWGSPDFNKLDNNLADITYTGPTQASNGDTITLSATLLDHNAATTIATTALGAPQVTFAVAGETCNATADSSGHASCSVTIGDAPGHYKVIAVFAGDAGYKAVSQTKDFTVLHIPTTVTYTGDTSGEYNDVATLSGTLTDNSNSQGIPNETLTFKLGAEQCSGTTDGNGNASCTVTPLDNPGPYTVSASFAGDEPTYEPSSASPSFTISQEESVLTNTGPLTVHYHDPVTVSAQLTDPADGIGIPNKTVSFTLGPNSCSGTTDSSGNVSCSLTPTDPTATTLVESFAGDTDYVGSGATPAFAVTPEETTMKYTGPTVILAGAAGATLTATMVEDGANDNDLDGGSSAPNPPQTVTLSVGSQSCTGVTNSSGNVTCTIPSISVLLGPETVGAAFAGDTYYGPSSDSTQAIVFAFPSRGDFMLGDKTVAANPPTVTWWADTWWQLDVLSGGTAPSSAKGFAATIKLPTTTPANICSGNWTTLPGNSPPPVSGVPSYMGVVVSKAITKSGSGIAGNYNHIVVVKVNPGYSPSPSNHGTGGIVASFC